MEDTLNKQNKGIFGQTQEKHFVYTKLDMLQPKTLKVLALYICSVNFFIQLVFIMNIF